MDLNSLLAAAAAQDVMFWVASAAVALGLTLIIAAALAQTRRLRRRVTAAPPAVGPAPGIPQPAPEVSRSRGEQLESGHAGLSSDQLRQLLGRVRGLTTAVEALQPRTSATLFEPDESLLKESAGDVEYIYRAEIG